MAFPLLYRLLPERLRALWWNHQWPRSTVLWDFNDGGYQPPQDALQLTTDDITALQVCLGGMGPLPSDDDSKVKHIMSKLLTEYQEDVPVGFGGNYEKDSVLHHRPDFWQSPSMTLTSGVGDCDDWAILLYGLLRLAGVPSYRLKCCITEVVSNGVSKGSHFNLLYLAELDYEWYTLEGSWYPLIALNRYLNQPRKLSTDLYGKIYFTFNEEYLWAQHDFLIKPVFLQGDES